ncbi:MAG: helix-turn-helix domain-containing protein [Patescibacteria group bacterium]
MKEIDELLRDFGLSSKEIQVLMAVFQAGKISPAAIAKLTKLKRPTVYVLAKELAKRGFLLEDTTGKTINYLPTQPEYLSEVIEREHSVLAEKERIIKNITESLKSLPRSSTYAVPKIRFVEGEKEVEQFLYRQIPEWFASMEVAHTRTWWGFQDSSFVQSARYRKWIEWHWKQMPNDFDLRLLSNISDTETAMQGKISERRRIRFWEDADFTATQWFMGEYSVMIMTSATPHYLVETKDAVYARNMRALFKHLWQEVSK